MSSTGPVPGVTPAVGPSPLTPVNAPTSAAQLAAQLAASVPLLDVAMGDPAQAATRAVAQARELAAERQGAMTPLLADLSAALDAGGAPPQVRSAIAQVLALQTPATPMLDGPTLQRAVAQSGVMLEARLASTIPTEPAPGQGALQAPPPPTGQPPADLKAALLTLQSALKAMTPPPPLAQSAAPPPAAGFTPYAAAQAAEALPGAPVSPSAPGAQQQPTAPQATGVQAAASQASQAAQLPAGVEQVLEAAGAPPALKLAAAQVLASHAPALSTLDVPMLRSAIAQLQPLLDPQARTPTVSSQPPSGPPAAADVETALTVLQGLLKSVQAAPARRAAPPPPPTRDGDLAAAAVPSSRDIEPEAALERLPAEVEQALARQTLHQLASAPEGGKPPSWVFELPLLTPQGQTVAQFAVTRDGARRGGGGDDDDKAAWRARFALDVPPLGKVHVHLRMEGDRSSAVLWAEDGAALEQLKAGGGVLAGALGGEVTFHPGAPRPAPPAAPGQFVDQKS